MPITPYVRPQETITQILRATPAPSVNRRNPLVIGPQFLLGNYSDATRHFQGPYSVSDTLEYIYLDEDGNAVQLDTNEYTVDLDSVVLFAKNIEVRVSHLTNNITAKRGATNTVIKQNVGTDYFSGPVVDLHPNQNDRAIKVGDIIYATVAAVQYRRTVVGLTTDSQGRATHITLNGILPGAEDAVVTFFVCSLFNGELTSDVLDGTILVTPEATSVDHATFTFKKDVFDIPGTGVAPEAVVESGNTGELAVYFRATKTVSETEGVITINSLGDLDQLGPLHIDNWLAYGAYQAFKGNQSSKIYVLRTSGDTTDAFTEALNKIRSTDYYYALAPMTDEEAVKELVAAHCDEMSNKYNRNFRRCYVGTDTPAGGLEIWGAKTATTLRACDVDATNKRIVIDAGDLDISNFLTDLSVGDTVILDATAVGGVVTGGDSVTISRIISNAEAEYTGTTAATGASTIAAIRKDSAANVVKYFQERNIGSRRCVNVWSDNPVAFGVATSYTGSTRMPMKFVAAEIAGLRCALLPQQGLTMTEVKSIDAAPGMYTRFTPEQLDTIASQGVMVVTQEIEGGEIFIRHQLTTQTDAGALAYEDNVGVIVDEFSYRVKDAFRQYLGRRNVTRETIAEIASKLKDLAIEATQESIANREIGPMVIRFFDEEDNEGQVTARVDGNLADHILTYVRLRVPLPINGIDHYIDVETSVEL